MERRFSSKEPNKWLRAETTVEEVRVCVREHREGMGDKSKVTRNEMRLTFTAYSTHSRLLGFLTYGEFILPGVVCTSHGQYCP